MMKYNGLLALLFLLLVGCTSAFQPAQNASGNKVVPTQVMLLATLHGLHKSNPNYTYDHVYELIRRYNPDIIGVEIRPEDIDQDTSYLKQLYPLEMRQITVLFPRDKVYGVDWYGEEAAGQLLPPDAFKGGNKQLTEIKQLERNLNSDTTLRSRMKMIAVFPQKMIELASTSTPAEFNNSGHYDLVAELYYKQLDILLQGTPYAAYANFNRSRDEHIGSNIISLIEHNPGKKLVFVLGANHSFAAEKTIREKFGENVKLVEVPGL
ncbi:hypothetical protein [Pontibacter sp. HSC-36F09]|uniref:hypothetical protein n=1 Tax=Pontibacter sp. HSC-36F09 TaxID=2910966 RepID=UPI00209E7CFC|nr:hypothetical protein [Pontibacter sp. HSC-36F09]MCP2043271.1 hypothetical protein [Pontibacter sp. HSC-36F09]